MKQTTLTSTGDAGSGRDPGPRDDGSSLEAMIGAFEAQRDAFRRSLDALRDLGDVDIVVPVSLLDAFEEAFRPVPRVAAPTLAPHFVRC